MMCALIMVDAAQKHAQTLVAVVRCDGQEYPTYAGEGLANRLLTGKQPQPTVAVKVVDAYPMDRQNAWQTDRHGDRGVVRDRKTMTDTSRTFNSEGKQISVTVLVYDQH
jgi:hypothetical protein